MEYRTERDSLGEVRVPASAYYGAQTARALENYPISGLHVHPAMVENYVLLKKVLQELGSLDVERGAAIIRAADEILGGALRDQFVVDAFHSGAGTSFHMNVNEVLAGRANEILAGTRGGTSPVHPNDHVNMSQSTNDTFPTVMSMAARRQIPALILVLGKLSDALAERGAAFREVVKSGRTHLQDAVPVTLGQEFAAYAEAVRRAAESITSASRRLEELAIGGSAVGTGLNTHPRFRFKLVERISQHCGIEFWPATDLRASMQSNYPIAAVSSALRMLALEILRICNDLRLLASGPATGLAEIVLPAAQPGSSIMPGKVNPSIPEMTSMVCFQVIGNDTAIAWAVSAGQLELNVMMPVMAHNLLQSIQITVNALRVLTLRCVAGITANAERCRHYAESSTSLATALNPLIGYDRAADIVKESLATGKTIVDLTREKSGLSAEELARIFDVGSMAQGGRT
jgi:aspartate ammonia-lyase